MNVLIIRADSKNYFYSIAYLTIFVEKMVVYACFAHVGKQSNVSGASFMIF